MKHLIVSLHDVHPGSLAAVMEQREVLRMLGVGQCSLLMVPRFHHETKIVNSPETIAWGTQCQLRGDELVLHGYYHDCVGQPETIKNIFWSRFYTARESEFLDLHEIKVRERIERGRGVFAQCGWTAHGFIAPAWLMGPKVTTILREVGFTYTNTANGIYLLNQGDKFVPCRSLCWSVRSAWRRLLSPMWNHWLFGRNAGHTPMRISLHPRDFEFVTIRKQITTLVKRALDAGYEPISYASYATR